ncbi:MAG: TrmB family transcriptional regulator, partial [Candidatus Nanoarchaeia archaeon]
KHKNKMIVKNELIKKIRGYFDLNIYETKIWLALLSKGVSSAGEIAEASSVPRSRTYDVLESLEKRGFVIQKLGKPVKYLAVKPEIVIEKLKNNTMHDAEEKVKTLSNLKNTKEYEELQELHKTGIEPIKNQELSTAIKGRSNVYTQMKEVIENANKSVYIASSSYELLSKNRMFENLFKKLKKNGVDIKAIIPEGEEEAKKLTRKFNIEVKNKKINSRFVIVDKREVIFTIRPANAHEDFDHAIWINSEFFVNTLAYFFELAWKD